MNGSKLKWGLALALPIALIAGFPATSTGQSARQSSRTPEIVRHNNLGVAFMEQLKFEDAAREFAKVVTADPSFLPGHVNLGIAAFYRQDYEPALKAFDGALKIDPKQVQAHYMKGLLFRNQDRIAEALAEFEAVHAVDADDPSTNYFLGLLYSREKDYAKAARYLQKAIEEQPYNASAHYNLAIALMRSGDRETGQRTMERFRQLQGQFGTDTVGLQYLEQGRYSLVIDRLDRYLATEPSRQNPEVRFVDVAETVGIQYRHAAPKMSSWRAPGESWDEVAQFIGPGVSFGDFNGDGADDLFIADASGRSVLYQNRGNGTFQDVTGSAGVKPGSKSTLGLWGDLDNDGHLDLYLINFGRNTLYRNTGRGTFEDTTAKSKAGDPAWGVGGALVDLDHDGDLDIVVTNFLDTSVDKPNPNNNKGLRNTVFRNAGDGTFEDVTESSGLVPDVGVGLSAIATDFNNSRDIDLLTLRLGAVPALFSNQRDGSFKNISAGLGITSKAMGGVDLGDFNQDGYLDIALATSVDGSPVLLANQRGLRVMPTELPASAKASFQTVRFFDFDNDGDLDLLLAGPALFSEGSGPGTLVLLENANGRFQDATRRTGLGGIILKSPVRAAATADFDNDGDLDIVLSTMGGAPLMLRNEGGNRNNWIQVALAGTNSNRTGFGTKVEVLSGSHWQKMESASGHGFLSQSSPVVHFGLGQNQSLDVLRMLWPGGVLQAEIDRPINKRITIEELDRKGTSCPILYVWDGQNYRFQTDFLGGSAFGYLLAPGVYNTPDTDEYIKLDRDILETKNGGVALTLNNQLEEVIYFDQAELVVVDHPSEYEIFPNEKLLPGPPYDSFRLYTARHPRPPVAARDGNGNDILPQIAAIDRVYPQLFEKLPFKGYAKEHAIEFDLGETFTEHTVLLLHAWIDYADSTSNLAASQSGLKLTPPYLQVKDAEGSWVTVVERMGFPAGLPKAMMVDLSGKFLSASREVRIVTNMRIYWDQILVDDSPQRTDYRMSRLGASTADLHFRGFPKTYSPDGNLPNIYDYNEISAEAPWKVHVGAYTRFGDVRPLLETADNKYVVTRSGDEIEVFFDLAGLPELPSGWTRDYLLFVVGFGKDMDINSAAPDFVGPLPFHEMKSFPYPPESDPTAANEFLDYLRTWNTRVVEDWVDPLPGKRREALAPAGAGGPELMPR